MLAYGDAGALDEPTRDEALYTGEIQRSTELDRGTKIHESPNKENVPLIPAPRGILKKPKDELVETVETPDLETKRSVSFKDIPSSKLIPTANENLTTTLEACTTMILKLWARHQARRHSSNYIARIPIVFQPGVTSEYIKFVVSLPVPSLHDDSLTIEQKLKFNIFIDTFCNRPVHIIKEEHDANLNGSASVLIIECSDIKKIHRAIETYQNSEHCLILLTKPVVGLNLAKFERILGVKLRPMNLPRLKVRPYNLDSPYLKPFKNENYAKYHGIPRLLEIYGKQNLTDENIRKAIIKELALWQVEEYKPYMHYWTTLFYYAQASTQIYSHTLLDVNPYITVFDAALALGFEADESTATTKSSDRDSTYTIICLDQLKMEFAANNQPFDFLTVLQKDSLKWYEAEKAVALAMASYSGSNGEMTFGDRFCFLQQSFLKDKPSDIKLAPQVLPKVTKKGKVLNEQSLAAWSLSSRLAPPQPTMLKSQWPKLLSQVVERQTMLNVEASKAPDYMVLVDSDYLLCFKVKTGIQEPTMDKLKKEVAKSPYLDIDANGEIVKNNDEIFITFVFVAFNHNMLKHQLKECTPVPSNNNDNSKREKKIHFHKEYIHIQSGWEPLMLPEKVEIIILRQPGLQDLFGSEGYDTLPTAGVGMKALRNESLMRQQILSFSNNTSNVEELKTKVHQLLLDVSKVPNGRDILKKELQAILQEDETNNKKEKEKKGKLKKKEK